jgi:hypothetical protein
LTAIRSLVPLDPPWIAAVAGSEVFLSPDYGDTWKPGAELPSGVAVHGIVPLGGNRLIAATSVGLRLLIGFDGSWRPTGGSLEGDTVQAICRHSNRTLFAASHGLIYESGDSGLSWTPISPQLPSMGPVKQLVVVPGTPDRLFVLTRQQGVYVLLLETHTPLPSPVRRASALSPP